MARPRSTTPQVDRAGGWASWHAIGTYVDLRTDPDAVDAAAEIAVSVLDEVDRCYSRFRPDSELSRLNSTSGEQVGVSPLLLGAIQVAIQAARDTDGLVDPTMLPVLVAGGYDRTFVAVPASSPSPAAVPALGARWQDIELGPDWVSLPAPHLLDLGATGKALAADLIALQIVAELDLPVLVSLGGDVRVAGPPDLSGGDGFEVAIGHTLGQAEQAPQLTMPLDRGGLATSSRLARSWERAGQRWHHLIDPRTGAPAESPWVTVTATGPTAVAANTATTAAMILGEGAVPWLDARGIPARLVAHDGSVMTTTGFEAGQRAH